MCLEIAFLNIDFLARQNFGFDNFAQETAHEIGKNMHKIGWNSKKYLIFRFARITNVFKYVLGNSA